MFTFSKAINRSSPNGIPGRPHVMGAPIYLSEDRYGAIFKAQGPVNTCKAYGASPQSPQSHTPAAFLFTYFLKMFFIEIYFWFHIL